MSLKYCPVCRFQMSEGLAVWHHECPKCLYESAVLEPAINESFAHLNINENFRETGLRSLRIANFENLLQAIKKVNKNSNKVLDVGCAHGWFLEAAIENGFDVLGIEPDLNIFSATAQRGLPVRKGFFPEVLLKNERFDIIVFNDVFEHIPDLNSLLAGCRDHLNSDGVLVLNLPNSKGIFYKCARFLSKIGFNSFFERLWQKDLPSPHLHYFHLENLNELLRNNGFETIASGRLSTLRLKGLFTRISYTGNLPFLARLLVYLVVVLSLPVLSIIPSDIFYTISRKNINT